MARDPDLVQKGFGLKAAVAGELATHYRSRLINAIRGRQGVLDIGPVTIYLAEEFGFCYGVDRAIDYAYETRRHFPDRTIYVTNEIIHNPFVNNKLRDMGFRFFEDGYSIDDLGADDIVLLPAFGATVEQIDEIKKRQSVIVDTTCGSVMNVWKRVERYGQDGFTSVMHGKYYHEETIATMSRALNEGGHYIVVLNEAEAQLVIDTMLGLGLGREDLLERFSNSVSEGFDPDVHLKKIGIANQTTMLASESSRISTMFAEAIVKRDGDAKNFREFDTICSATQDRQDAILRLGQGHDLDVILVIGGYNSSNTTHLCKMARRFARSFHIAGAEALLSSGAIEHLKTGAKDLSVSADWLGDHRPVKLGVTSGASTPNSIVSDVLLRIGEMFSVDPMSFIGPDEGLEMPEIEV
jgi:4-hydroxy-3-methylbut-2-en-1-yl diphosphate reductase